MTRDEARDLFATLYDDQRREASESPILDPSARAELLALLASDVELGREYLEFEAVMKAVAVPTPQVDLLPNIQRKLRTRSRGKFYRDAFSERAGLASQAWVAIVVALITLGVVCAYFTLSATVLP